MHIFNKIHVLLATLCYMFRRLLRHLQGELCCVRLKQFWYLWLHRLAVLLEDGSIRADTCRRLLIIRVFHCICAFRLYVKDIITVRKMHGMGSFTSVADRSMYMKHVQIQRISFFLNNQPDAPIIQIYSVIKLYMFRASSLPIIRSFLLYIRHW